VRLGRERLSIHAAMAGARPAKGAMRTGWPGPWGLAGERRSCSASHINAGRGVLLYVVVG